MYAQFCAKIRKNFVLHSPFTFFIFFRLHFRHVELIALLEHFPDRIDFQELSSTTQTDVTTEIGYLVIKLDIAFLAKHTNSSQEELLAGDMVFLINRNHSIGEVEQALQLVLIANGQHGMWTSEGSQ